MGQPPQPPASSDRSATVSQSQQEIVIPVLAEQLVVFTMEQDTGGVRAVKKVRQNEQLIDVPLLREQVTVERKSIQKILEEPAQARQEGEVFIIPVMEEVLTIQRRYFLKEEIHIRKTQTEVHEPQRYPVRSEEVTIEHLPAQDEVAACKQPPPAPQTKGE